MSQFEKSEVMVEYAKLMRPDLVKVAWTWRDIVSNLGVEVAGTLAGVALFGGAMTPVGWVLAGAGLAYAIYDAVSMSDDNVSDLIERIGAMDYEGTTEQARVEGWLSNLERMRGALQSPPTTTDPAERAQNNGRMLMALSELQMYLNQVAKEWAQVAPRMKDWSLDVGQAKAALDTTLQAVNTNLANIKQQVSAAKAKMLQEAGKASGVDIKSLSKQIVDTYKQIAQVDGAPPVAETSQEAMMLGFVNKVLQSDGQLTRQQADQYAPQLQKMLESFTKLLEQAKSKKSASTDLMLSKRAWRLSSTPPQAAGKAGRQGKEDRTATRELQKLLNQLNKAYETGGRQLRPDGIYGPNTASAFGTLASKVKEVGEELSKAGLDAKTIANPKIMRSSAEKIREATQFLRSVAKNVKTTSKEPTGIWDLENRRDLSENEILYYLDNKMAVNPLTGEKDTLLNHIRANTRKMLGKMPKEEQGKFLSRFKMSAVDLIKRIYFREGQTAPVEWDNGQFSQLFDALGGGTYGSVLF